MMKTVVLEIVGEQRMHCEGCQERVETMLGELPGVRKVRAQARKQCVEVLFDPAQVQAIAIEERMREAGYETKGTTTA
jgi:copper chaperone